MRKFRQAIDIFEELGCKCKQRKGEVTEGQGAVIFKVRIIIAIRSPS